MSSCQYYLRLLCSYFPRETLSYNIHTHFFHLPSENIYTYIHIHTHTHTHRYLNRIVSVWRKEMNSILHCTHYYKTAFIMAVILSSDRSPWPHLQVTGTPRTMMPSVTWHSWTWFMLNQWLNTRATFLTRLRYHVAFPNHHITCGYNNCVHLHPHWIKKHFPW
jgi:hypothetical protein